LNRSGSGVVGCAATGAEADVAGFGDANGSPPKGSEDGGGIAGTAVAAVAAAAAVVEAADGPSSPKTSRSFESSKRILSSICLRGGTAGTALAA